MEIPRGYRIDRIELKTASDAEISGVARLRQRLGSERTPEDPPTPVPIIEQQLRANPPGSWRGTVVARDATGAIVGYGHTYRNLKDVENAHVRWSDVGVAPEHRRRGLGRALFAGVVAACEGQGENLMFIGVTNDRVPSGEAFARSVGAKPGLPMKLNQLDLREVDRAKVREWARIDPPGYRLERIDDTVPQALVKPYIEAANGINDMPRGDIAFNDWKLDEPQIRQREAYYRQAGRRWWLILAVHQATGAGVGFTEVEFDPRDPHAIEQQGTAVVAAHRGHRLGLWMKAAMLERILDELRESRFIRTGNANVNQQMLAINTQLGFRQAWQDTLWQIPIAEARKVAGAKTAKV